MNKINLTSLFAIATSLALFTITILPASAQFETDAEEILAQGSPRSALDDQRVLVIGDSQVAGQPGITLGHHLVAAGVVRYARAGQSGWGVKSWYNNRNSMNHLIARHQPTLLVLILGGNDWYLADNEDYPTLVVDFWNYLTEEVDLHAPDETTPSVCWVAPPVAVGDRNIERQVARDKVAETILEKIGETHFVESRDLTRSGEGRTADGIHFTRQGANKWMRETMPRLERCVERQL